MVRRINVRGSNIHDINDRQAQLKERLKRSASRRISDVIFDRTSYTDAMLMLVETDITIQYKQMGHEKLFASDPRYNEIVWSYFAARILDEEWMIKLEKPQTLFATMMDAVCTMGEIKAGDLYSYFMDENKMEYAGVKGSFQRIRVPGEDRYQQAFMLEDVKSMEALYDASMRLACCAIDAYTVNYTSGWAELTYGPPYNCMNRYLERHGVKEVFTLGGDESDLYSPQEDPTLDPTPFHDMDDLLVQPDTIDRNPETETHWRNTGVNRLLP